ncbi:MAG: PLP-dependent aminotransferase family protein [Sideroxyarcus sp.]|nr:PLP-dependent aminotransferase family protein [Sideroxyarcus sp.]
MNTFTNARSNVMNFLNEAANRFPQAISFASGRPADQFMRMDQYLGGLATFADHVARNESIPVSRAIAFLSQYGRTAGIINSLVARQINNDEGIVCELEQILITAGCQEALALCIRALCGGPDDVLLTRSPAYIGVTGAADSQGIAICGFPCTHEHELVSNLLQAIDGLRTRGKRPRAFYLVPTFDNPSGVTLSREIRKEVIALCAAQDIVILEDDPYGMFSFEAEKVPAMYTLDQHECVVYLGTYSKTLCPALRVGYAVMPLRLTSGPENLLERIVQMKSFGTLNTSQLSQSIVGGLLLNHECSLTTLVAPMRELYRVQRDCMLAALRRTFGANGELVCWNVPKGGFFLTVDLPFEFEAQEAWQCAADYRVIVLPLSFFALVQGEEKRIRLAYSNATAPQIEQGIQNLGEFVRRRLSR